MDRIERHDIINALFLALALLVMALVLSILARKLVTTVQDNDIVSSVSSDDVAVPVVTSTSSTTEPTTSTTEAISIHVPNEVQVLVSNSARVGGIAGQASDILKAAGYATLRPTNGDTVEQSVVYYADGFEGDAVQVAGLLGMSSEAIAPVTELTSVSAGEANLVAIIGTDQALR